MESNRCTNEPSRGETLETKRVKESHQDTKIFLRITLQRSKRTALKVFEPLACILLVLHLVGVGIVHTGYVLAAAVVLLCPLCLLSGVRCSYRTSPTTAEYPGACANLLLKTSISRHIPTII